MLFLVDGIDIHTAEASDSVGVDTSNDRAATSSIISAATCQVAATVGGLAEKSVVGGVSEAISVGFADDAADEKLLERAFLEYQRRPVPSRHVTLSWAGTWFRASGRLAVGCPESVLGIAPAP